jgi:RNA polymerase sigma-70 factor (ECF subfamily)
LSEKSNIRPLFQGNQSEELILEGVRQGRDGAFSALYNLYADRIFRLAVHMLRDEEAAQQVLQETFLRVFRKIHSFKKRSTLGTWIYRIALNTCLNELKKTSKEKLVCTSYENLIDAEDEGALSCVEDETRRRELRDLLQEMLDGLDPKKRLTFMLHYVDELTADEIADILQEGRGTVLKRLQRTRSELMEKASRMRVGGIHEAVSHVKGGKK